ncbi:hypothetical protein GCM10010435_94860 [Winogradskya consettensis]|uniref:Uncharacterized protein n=1 Tax=Winogradskya consettensis TaxID=113560 RepID=A0A919SVU5_9ACTN|nr:Imm1 family immunity protein [Actinoplanes consettensis]GIM79800.1 hypothetical protein Aco04nite_67360 [Actinoplanes consettensis]
MLLSIDFKKELYRPRIDAELSGLIAHIFAKLDHERDASIAFEDGSQAPVLSPGDEAWCTFDERYRGEGEPPSGKALLRLAVNAATGYGSLTWMGTAPDGQSSDLYDHIWVSDNPQPLDWDPRVVGDPYVPTFHDPRNALPIFQIRSAVDEYCSTEDGERPAEIRWAHGEFDGQRPGWGTSAFSEESAVTARAESV